VNAYPFDKLKAPDGDGVVLVDVGGGDGRMLRRIRQKFPEMKGKAVLQDLPSVIRQGTVVDEMESAEAVGYDFFSKPQPVNGE
jgi:ubiquinone/menaquinone biosynthesis C-methylase UbiE